MGTHEKDPAHWLYRLSVEEWLSAADHELSLCEAALARRALPPEEAVGEFIGLARFSAAGARAVRGVWTRARQGEGGLEAPFGRAARLRQAYLSDALNALADGGTRLAPLFIDGRWREIDTEEDLSRAHAAVGTWRD